MVNLKEVDGGDLIVTEDGGCFLILFMMNTDEIFGEICGWGAIFIDHEKENGDEDIFESQYYNEDIEDLLEEINSNHKIIKHIPQFEKKIIELYKQTVLDMK